jgi:rare lipoprotein A
MLRAIGISVACLVTTACAIVKASEESASHSPGETAGFRQGNGETPTDEFHSSAAGLLTMMGSPTTASGRVERREDACGGIAESYRNSWRTTGIRLFGKAAWYNLVGRQTANGEILDTITATAAHRSLPLASYAKVTDLDNGRSVVVKINDRGPYTPGRILDLSPRAADALDMKRTGVAMVVVEPLMNQAAPTLAVFQTSGWAIAQ